jgi:uncharacterized protein (DUF433 family)
MSKQISHTNDSPQLGEGIFLIKDVSNALRLPYSKVRRWINEFDKCFGNNGGLYSFGEQGNKAVNFYTLIEFHTFYQLRLKGISSQQIKKFHDFISKELKTKYPFAHSDIRTDGKKMWFEYFDNLVKHDNKRQLDWKHIIAPFLHRIEYGNDKIAKRFYPLDKSKNIVIDPKHQFGQPTIIDTNIKTATLYNLHKGGEPNKSICLLYDLKVKQVSDAILYHKQTA